MPQAIVQIGPSTARLLRLDQAFPGVFALERQQQRRQLQGVAHAHLSHEKQRPQPQLWVSVSNAGQTAGGKAGESSQVDVRVEMDDFSVPHDGALCVEVWGSPRPCGYNAAGADFAGAPP